MKRLLIIGLVALSSCGNSIKEAKEKAEKVRIEDEKAGLDIANDKELEEALDNAVDMPEESIDTTELDLGLDEEEFDPEAML